MVDHPQTYTVELSGEKIQSIIKALGCAFHELEDNGCHAPNCPACNADAKDMETYTALARELLAIMEATDDSRAAIRRTRDTASALGM